PDGLSLLDAGVLDWTAILSARQVTDVYLLALAVANDGRFVTFDRAVPLRGVQRARPEHLVLL
ncbi:MAG: VapC toxin family PIN domain ribonuclease, partial [Gammaproteobacteria bacterium]|nr:VapC toxin family PIN domain ribonuclease [Gammaproteobacteria bacterium]